MERRTSPSNILYWAFLRLKQNHLLNKPWNREDENISSCRPKGYDQGRVKPECQPSYCHLDIRDKSGDYHQILLVLPGHLSRAES
uniref:Predicted protein n=1 Tax=Hordeum vulgare subsp. vulgare TaxID=112509 RepID=F2DQZ7_HORVV|nr:predicted protein [Hordeum vulgare subsp. vulgare]